jgi:hypothetical protein
LPKKEDRPPSVPTSFAETTPPVPSGDYSYVLEIVMNMQMSMGKLTEAVESLKSQVKDHGVEIKAISTDIHTAKTTLKIIGGILTVGLAFAGWAINKGVDAYVASHQQTVPAASQRK